MLFLSTDIPLLYKAVPLLCCSSSLLFLPSVVPPLCWSSPLLSEFVPLYLYSLSPHPPGPLVPLSPPRGVEGEY